MTQNKQNIDFHLFPIPKELIGIRAHQINPDETDLRDFFPTVHDEQQLASDIKFLIAKDSIKYVD